MDDEPRLLIGDQVPGLPSDVPARIAGLDHVAFEVGSEGVQGIVTQVGAHGRDPSRDAARMEPMSPNSRS